MTKRDGNDESERLITWSLCGGTYVAVPESGSCGPGRLDEGRANSLTDEGGPPHSGPADDCEPE